jgi:GDPmannose 4,6-dehydratase
MSKNVIVTGVTGQDGSHMVDYLLQTTDHKIYGSVRRLSVSNHINIDHVSDPRFEFINLDLTDSHSIESAIIKYKPDYFINLAAQSFVGTSWDFPAQTFTTNATSILHMLEAIKKHKPDCKFYNAGSSEEFGNVDYSPQDKKHPLKPRSPYGASKCAARLLTKVYRESYDLFAIQCWLFNHEGTRRGIEFVTRKISDGIARIDSEIKQGLDPTPIVLGNLDAERDWMDAEDAVRGIWQILNLPEPREYVIGTGKTNSIRSFLNIGFNHIGLDTEWSGQGLNEKLTCDNHDLVTISEEFYRPAEVSYLKADIAEAESELNWKPSISFEQLVQKMVQNDINIYERKNLLNQATCGNR